MALGNTFFRQADNYTPAATFGNYNRYQSLEGNPLRGFILDSDMNYLIDSLNILGSAIDEINNEGVIGAAEILNANKVLISNGSGYDFDFIDSDNIADGSITNSKLALNSISTNNLINSSVTDEKISSVRLGKISHATAKSQLVYLDNNGILNPAGVTPAKTLFYNQLGTSTVKATLSDIWNDNPTVMVTEGRISPASINTNHLQDSAVTEAKINNSAVTEAKINNSAVTTNKIVDLAVSSDKISNSAITLNKLNRIAYTKGSIVFSGTAIINQASTSNLNFGNFTKPNPGYTVFLPLNNLVYNDNLNWFIFNYSTSLGAVSSQFFVEIVPALDGSGFYFFTSYIGTGNITIYFSLMILG